MNLDEHPGNAFSRRSFLGLTGLGIGAIAAKTKVAWVRTNATVSRRKSEMVSGVVRTTTKPCEGLERRRQPPADALSTLSAA